MKGVQHFIIHIPALHAETIKTDSGVEIFLDSRFSKKETANNIFQVEEIPLDYEGPIKKGWWVMVDPTMVFEQTYEQGGKQENVYLVDRENSLYKAEKGFIICFKEKGGDEWIGFNGNVICSRLKPDSKNYEKVGSIYMADSAIPKSVKGQMEVVITNKNLQDSGVEKGDVVFVNEKYTVPIAIEGVLYQWLRTKEILAKNTAA